MKRGLRAPFPFHLQGIEREAADVVCDLVQLLASGDGIQMEQDGVQMPGDIIENGLTDDTGAVVMIIW